MEGVAGPVIDCTCDAQCPGAHDCTCLEIIGPPRQCSCTCNGFPIVVHTTLKAAEPVNLEVRNAEVGAIAEFLHRVTKADILVPAAAMRSRVTVKLADVPFADAVGELGLVLRQPDDTAY